MKSDNHKTTRRRRNNYNVFEDDESDEEEEDEEDLKLSQSDKRKHRFDGPSEGGLVPGSDSPGHR